jgi:hypothetical protein
MDFWFWAAVSVLAAPPVAFGLAVGALWLWVRTRKLVPRPQADRGMWWRPW